MPRHNPLMERLKMNMELARIAQARVNRLEKDAEKAHEDNEKAKAAVQFAREALQKQPMSKALQTK